MTPSMFFTLASVVPVVLAGTVAVVAVILTLVLISSMAQHGATSLPELEQEGAWA